MQRGSQLVLLGKVVATHGIRGQLRVVTYSGEAANLVALDSIMLKGPKGELDTFVVANASIHGKRVLFTLKDYNSINQVTHLVGRELYACREQLPELAPGEYYWCDLLGLAVVTDAGESLGRLTDIIATGSNDVYVVQGDGREYLIPALEEIVLKIDPEAGLMTVSPPEGLFDL